MAANCDCISKTNKALEEAGMNAVMNSHLCMTKGGKSLGLVLQLPLLKKDSKQRKPLPTIVVSYCPICGTKYGTGVEDASKESGSNGVESQAASNETSRSIQSVGGATSTSNRENAGNSANDSLLGGDRSGEGN